MSSTAVGIISIIALIIYCIFYKRICVDETIPFSLFIYIAMFPYKIRGIGIPNQLDDVFLKALLLGGFIWMILWKKKIRLNLYELSLFAVAILSFFVNSIIGNEVSVSNLINLAFVMFFSLYAYSVIENEKQLEIIYRIFTINGIILSFCAYYEFYMGGVRRVFFALSNPNYFAFYMFICVAASVYMWYITQRGCYLICLVLSVMAILCTGSYSIIIGLLIAAVLFIIYKCGNLNGHTAVLIQIIFFAVIFSFMIMIIDGSYVNNTLISLVISGKDTVRIYVWREAINQWKSAPILGIGYGVFNAVSGVNDVVYVSHNDFLRILTELGIAGIAVFLIYSLKETSYIENAGVWYKKWFLHALIIGTLVFSAFHNNINSYMFWFVMSLPLYYRDIARMEEINYDYCSSLRNK